MKKALCFVLGAMLMALLPGQSAKAQNKTIELGVRTLDQAALQDAWIFAGADSANYFVDSTHLDGTYTNLVCTDTAVSTMALTLSTDGYSVLGVVDSAIYGKGAIVARDVNGRIYVYSASTQTERANGIIKVTNLFTAADSLKATLTVAGNVLMPYSFVARDNRNWSFSTLAAAIADAAADTITFMADTVTVDTMNITRNVVVNQSGRAMKTLSGQPVTLTGASVVWNGGNGRIVSANANGTLFKVMEGASLNIQGVVAEQTNPITVEDGGTLVAVNDTFKVVSPGIYAIIAKGTGNVTVGTGVGFVGGTSGISLSDDFTGTANVATATVTNMSAYDVPVRANVYSTNGANNTYFRTIKQASTALPTQSTVKMARNIPVTENDTVVNGISILMEGDSVKAELHLAHTSGLVYLTNGYVNILSTETGNASSIIIDSIDVDANFAVGNHFVTINGGRFTNIDASDATPQTLSIYGGKFAGNPRATLRQFLHAGKAFGANPDADAARYPYKVVDGYTVTWANWDYMGSDTMIVYNNADHYIAPVFGRNDINYKDGIDLDTLFIGWYIDDIFFNTPWNFPTDELVSDTTLYARYMVVDRNVTSEYSVMHMRQNLARTAYDTANVFVYADSTGHDISLHSALYYGYEVVGSADTTISGNDWSNGDTVHTFYYNRARVPITWAAGEGYVDGNYPNHYTDDTLYFGDTIDYDALGHFATREGYTFAGWDSTLVTVTYHTDTIWAQYIQNTYAVTWKINGAVADTNFYTTPYTAAPFTGISAVYTDDSGNEVEANLTFINEAGDTIRTPEYPAAASTWTVWANPVNPAYLLGDNTFTLTITPATLTVSGVVVDTIKFYDGSRIANVTNQGTLVGAVGSDVIDYSVVALYDTPDTGTGKVIKASYHINGPLAASYVFANTGDTLTRNGVIVEPIVPDNSYGDSNTGIAVEATGYCTGNGIINYQLTSGSPDQYKLSFSDSAFTDTNWQSITTAGQIVIDVPAGVEAGTYNVTIVFGDSRFPQLASNPVTVSFNVNLPETYTMPLFSDVIALVDTCHCFTDIHWFHRANSTDTWTEILEAQGQYYYQEEGGLTGEYYVRASMNGLSVFTCPQTDVTTLIVEDPAPEATVSAYPNPATDQVTLRIDGSAARIHTLRVMSVMGLNVESRTFEGDETRIDLRGLQAGNYVVSIDGIVVRVIKK